MARFYKNLKDIRCNTCKRVIKTVQASDKVDAAIPIYCPICKVLRTTKADSPRLRTLTEALLNLR